MHQAALQLTLSCVRKRMRSGDRPGLQNRRVAGHPVTGGFDPHSLPPCCVHLGEMPLSPAVEAERLLTSSITLRWLNFETSNGPGWRDTAARSNGARLGDRPHTEIELNGIWQRPGGGTRFLATHALRGGFWSAGAEAEDSVPDCSR